MTTYHYYWAWDKNFKYWTIILKIDSEYDYEYLLLGQDCSLREKDIKESYTDFVEIIPPAPIENVSI